LFEVQAPAYQYVVLTGGITIAVPLLMEVIPPCMGVGRGDHVFEDLLPTSCVMCVGSRGMGSVEGDLWEERT
jgi:hypothetical protein